MGGRCNLQRLRETTRMGRGHTDTLITDEGRLPRPSLEKQDTQADPAPACTKRLPALIYGRALTGTAGTVTVIEMTGKQLQSRTACKQKSPGC